MPRILFASYEVPGYGGASTATYGLVERLQHDGIDAYHLNLIDERDDDYYRFQFGVDYGNPRRLPNVINCHLQAPVYFEHPELVRTIRQIQPSLMVGVGFIGALLMKRSASHIPLIFLTSGCQQMKEALRRGKARDFIDYSTNIGNGVRRPDILSKEELEAVQISDLIIAHSEITLFLYEKNFPFHTGKLYSQVIWFSEWIYHEAMQYSSFQKPFDQREIDYLFAASSWDRIEKNYELVRQLTKLFPNLQIHILGEVPEVLPGVVHHPLTYSREEVFELMGNAKAVVCPSIFDAAPAILFEGSALGCNLIASPNCGNWKICNPDLLAQACTTNDFVKSMESAIQKKYDDQMNIFLSNASYSNLVEVLFACC